jgi:hypothetical protein
VPEHLSSPNSERISFSEVSGKQRFDPQQVERFLAYSADVYPEIQEWWRRRVVPDLHEGSRVCYTASRSGDIVGVCIGKFGKPSNKLCTLRVCPSVQSQNVGSQLLNRFFLDIMKTKSGRGVHFTISEAVDAECGSFFRELGFARQAWFQRPGRSAGDEWVYARSVVSPHNAGGLLKCL